MDKQKTPVRYSSTTCTSIYWNPLADVDSLVFPPPTIGVGILQACWIVVEGGGVPVGPLPLSLSLLLSLSKHSCCVGRWCCNWISIIDSIQSNHRSSTSTVLHLPTKILLILLLTSAYLTGPTNSSTRQGGGGGGDGNSSSSPSKNHSRPSYSAPVRKTIVLLVLLVLLLLLRITRSRSQITIRHRVQ